MKNPMMNSVLHHDSVAVNMHKVGIFIINAKGELLLECSTTPPYIHKDLWQVPLLLHEDTSTLLSNKAQHFVEGLGLECELNEAFTATHHSINIPCGHIIIARARRCFHATYFTSTNLKWLPLESVLIDSRDYPAHYAPWFLFSLEGVALFLKDIFYTPHQEETIFYQETS